MTVSPCYECQDWAKIWIQVKFEIKMNPVLINFIYLSIQNQLDNKTWSFLSLPRNSPTFENFLGHSCLVFGIRRWQVIISLPQNFSCIGITEIHPIDFETFENIFGFWRHDLWFDFVPTIGFDNVILQKLISRFFFSFLLVWVWLSHWHINFSRTIEVSVQCWFSQVQVKIVISKQAFPPTFLWESLQCMFSFSICFWVYEC